MGVVFGLTAGETPTPRLIPHKPHEAALTPTQDHTLSMRRKTENAKSYTFSPIIPRRSHQTLTENPASTRQNGTISLYHTLMSVVKCGEFSSSSRHDPARQAGNRQGCAPTAKGPASSPPSSLHLCADSGIIDQRKGVVPWRENTQSTSG